MSHFQLLREPPATAVETGEEVRSFLFVPGAWHGAAHWQKVVERLTAMGHRASAVDLPGSGLDARYPDAYLRNDPGALASEPSPVRDIGLDDYVDAVTGRLTELARHGRVTLVGHSFGGLTVTRVAEAVPHLIRRLVYVTAYVPVAHASGAELSTLPEGGESISGAILVGDYVEKGRLAFYGDLPAEEYARYAAFLTPDLPLAVCMADARGTAQRWGRVARTFVRTTDDRTIPVALQDRMIAEADAAAPANRFDVRTLASSHSPFASMPDELAELIAAA
jgi:pimeloyl-ACP methyl ester carboxylesterase